MDCWAEAVPAHSTASSQPRHHTGTIGTGLVNGRYWPDRDGLKQRLVEDLPTLPSCKYLYVLDEHAQQITANVSKRGLVPEQFGRDRSQRPYLVEALAGEPFSLSDAYISRNARRPSLTAVQSVALRPTRDPLTTRPPIYKPSRNSTCSIPTKGF